MMPWSGGKLAFMLLIIGAKLGVSGDGVFEDEVAERLDSLFGVNLLVNFMQSGEEDVPNMQEIMPTDLEMSIIEWFKTDDQLRPIDDIVAHFPNNTKDEVQNALDSLCEKGILYGGENFVGCMYGLV